MIFFSYTIKWMDLLNVISHTVGVPTEINTKKLYCKL